MKRITGTAALAAALAIPVAASAQQPTTVDQKNAATQCKALLKAEGTSNFKHAWGANGKGRAYGKCVSTTARQKAQERQAAQSNAAKDCKAEQAQSDSDFQSSHNGQTFAQFYGAKNSSSAYGKCVSTKAKQNQAESDAKDQETVNAARWCRGQQTQDPTFKQTYRNFGACVSKQAHELNSERQQQQTQSQAPSGS